eukprot:3322325-Pyramimonas_sp.AAC.1
MGANGILGSMQPDWLGDVGFVQNEDANGRALHECAAEQKYKVINTILSSGKSHHTWKDAYNNHRRIAYILADHDHAKYLYDSSAIEDFETLKKG